MKKVFILSACIIAFTTCTQNSAEYKRIQAENDSLKFQMKQNEVEMDETLAILNAVENDIQTIRSAEGLIDLQQNAELSTSKREQIKNNMSFITETINKNKKQLADLQNKLKASNVHSAALKQTIERLTKDLDDKVALVAQLQEALGQKDEHIRTLSAQNKELTTDVQILKGVSESQKEVIDEQNQAINTVYYCFGTTKELKDQNILTGGGLFSKAKALEGEFNKDYFITADKRKVREIQLFASKAKVRTNHPDGSYEFIKDRDGNITLKIKDPDKFWSISKYLVIVTG